MYVTFVFYKVIPLRKARAKPQDVFHVQPQHNMWTLTFCNRKPMIFIFYVF